MSKPIPSPDWLQDRLEGLGADIMVLSHKFPKTAAGTHYARQILRCGTAAAANYAEARGAESRADFIHKLRVVLKELNETATWLRMAIRSRLISAEITTRIVAENQELSRIVAASVKTARGSLNEK